MKRLVFAVAVLTGLASVVSAQSLAEVAQKEKERRKKVTAPAKNDFTESDLRRSLRTPSSSSTVTTTPSGSSTALEEESAEETTAEEDPTKTESYWRERVAAINQKIRELEARLQSPEMNADTRGALQRETVERDLAQARSEKEALAQEARQKGVPPGWVR